MIRLSPLGSSVTPTITARNKGTTILRRTLASQQQGTRRPSLTKPNQLQNRTDVEGIWYTPRQHHGTNLDMGRYGLRRIDYHAMRDHPPVWTLPPHPPTKSMSERVLFPLTLLVVGGLVVWTYMNPDDEDMRDYWQRVETGQILLDDDDDDDDDDVDEWDEDDDDKT
jgi:hypothetical protein